jgi:hypothetical protein
MLDGEALNVIVGAGGAGRTTGAGSGAGGGGGCGTGFLPQASITSGSNKIGLILKKRLRYIRYLPFLDWIFSLA